MGNNYWTLDGMMDSGKKKKTKETKEKKHGKDKEKDKKKKKKGKKEVFTSSEIAKAKRENCMDEGYMNYADFLKTEGEGLFIVKAFIGEDIEIETYIIKSKEFEFPRVALLDSGDSYKVWLNKELARRNLVVTVNKVLYGSKVKRIKVPKGFLNQVIEKSMVDDE